MKATRLEGLSPYLQNLCSNKETAKSKLFKKMQTSYETNVKLKLSLVNQKYTKKINK